MATVFEIGKSYEASDPGLAPIKIISRTAKTIVVYNGHTSWRMRIKYDKNGNEYVVDSSVGVRIRDEYLFSSKWCTE